MRPHEYIDSVISEATKQRDPKFNIGDKVKYAVKFLRSTGMYTGAMPRAKGIVTGVTRFGQDNRYLVSVDWDMPDLPGKILDSNLVLAGDPEYSSY